MNEQRFEFYSDEDLIGVLDTVTGRTFNSFEIIDCLNEQQATIHSLKEEVRLLKPTNIEQYEQIVQLQEENEQLKKELLRIQKTISSIQKEINNYYNEVCSNE